MAVIPSGRKTASGQTIWMAAPSSTVRTITSPAKTTSGGGTTTTSNAYYGTDTGQRVDINTKTSAFATDRYAKNPATGGIVDRYTQQSVQNVPATPTPPAQSFKFGGGTSGGTGTTGGFREVPPPTFSQLIVSKADVPSQPSPTQVAPITYPVTTNIESWSQQRMKESYVAPVTRTQPSQVPQGAEVTKPPSYFLTRTKEESLAAFPSRTLEFMGKELEKEKADYEKKWKPYISGETFVGVPSTSILEEKWSPYIQEGVFVGMPSDVGFKEKWGTYTQGEYFSGTSEQYQEYSKEYEQTYGQINKQFLEYTKELKQGRGLYEKQYGKFSEEQALLGSRTEWQNALSGDIYKAKLAEYSMLTSEPWSRTDAFKIPSATKDTGWWGQQEAAVAKYTTLTPIAQHFLNTKDLEYRYARLAAEERRSSFKQDSILKSMMMTELSISKKAAELEHGILEGIEQKPLTFGTMFAITAGAGLAEAGITTAIPKAVPYVKAATYGLLALYGISVAERIISQPTAATKTVEFGSILGTELLPMALAGVAVKQIKARLIPEPEVTLLGAKGQREITKSGEVLDIIYQKGKVVTAKGEPLFDINLEVTERYMPYRKGLFDVELLEFYPEGGGKGKIRIIPQAKGDVIGYRTWGAMEGTFQPVTEGAKPQNILIKTSGWSDTLGKSGFTKRGVAVTEFRAGEPRYEVGKGLGDVVVSQRPAPISYEEWPSWIQVGTEFKFDTGTLERISVARTTKIASALVSNVGEAPRTIEYYQSRGAFFEKGQSMDLISRGEKSRPPVLVEEISLEEAGKIWSKHQPYGNFALRNLRGAFFDFGEVLKQGFMEESPFKSVSKPTIHGSQQIFDSMARNPIFQSGTPPTSPGLGGGKWVGLTDYISGAKTTQPINVEYEQEIMSPQAQKMAGQVFGTQLKDFAAQTQRSQYLSLTKSYTLIRPITKTSLTSITKVTPVTKVTPTIKLMTISPVTKVTPRISEVLKVEPVTKVTPRISEVLKVEPVTKQKIEEVLKTEQLLKTQQVTKLSLKVPGTMLPPPIEPPPIWLGLPSLELPKGTGGIGKAIRESKGYKPSIYAVGLGITASSIPKMSITGLGLRPLITTKKKKAGKRKEILRMTGWLKKARRKQKLKF